MFSKYQKKQLRARYETATGDYRGTPARDDVTEACKTYRQMVALPSHSDLDLRKLSAVQDQLKRLGVDPYEEPSLRAQLARAMKELEEAESEEGPLSTSAYLEHWRSALRSRCVVLRSKLEPFPCRLEPGAGRRPTTTGG